MEDASKGIMVRRDVLSLTRPSRRKRHFRKKTRGGGQLWVGGGSKTCSSFENGWGGVRWSRLS